jgi:hypothetical protein
MPAARDGKPEKRSQPRERCGAIGQSAFSGTAGRDDASALTGLEAALRLIDDVDAALAAHETIVAMAAAQRFQRITDFHGSISRLLAG